jgi:hypothetical protein
MLWQYKAYDENLKIKDGYAEAKDFKELALLLRQSGWQVLEASKMNAEQVAAHNHLQIMKKRLCEEPIVKGCVPRPTTRELLAKAAVLAFMFCKNKLQNFLRKFF